MFEPLLLGLISVATSLLAAILGLGGGMLLIAILPMFLPAAVIIPIHGLVQLASNSSRMLFSLQDVQWRLLPKFLLGSLLGLLLFGLLLVHISSDYIPLYIGTYLLLSLWVPQFSALLSRYENFYWVGFFQSGLSLVVGATGPISATILAKNLADKNQIIATAAMFMALSHIAKIIFFAGLGFAFLEHSELLIYMIAGAILGSFLGTKIRNKISNEHFKLALKLCLSLLALKMLVQVF